MFARLPPALVLTLAIMAGASMDATIKWLAQTNHVLLVAFGRYLFGALFSLAIWWRAGKPADRRGDVARARAARLRHRRLRGDVLLGALGAAAGGGGDAFLHLSPARAVRGVRWC